MIDYPQIVDIAMRKIVRNVLRIVQAEGLQGDHHLFISFDTKAPGVHLSERMKKRYTEEITIVLQYQFEDLIVETNKFSVSLYFDNIKENVVVPFNALTSFADPSVKFSLQFIDQEDEHHIESTTKALHVLEDNDQISHEDPVLSVNNVIALDSFRHQKK